ncbi:MAG: cupin domain-containing protein [Gemmatimonadota bacterium]|nr:cupin domain-containing protein [Gemmatimonadota bacterium]
MIVRSDAAKQITFDGLEIRDYTPGLDHSSSLAIIGVPPGVQHRNARSTRSDKYYYVIEGKIRFTLGSDEYHLEEGDFCLVQKGVLFGYRNDTEARAILSLVHTPGFDLSAEVFED